MAAILCKRDRKEDGEEIKEGKMRWRKMRTIYLLFWRETAKSGWENLAVKARRDRKTCGNFDDVCVVDGKKSKEDRSL